MSQTTQQALQKAFIQISRSKTKSDLMSADELFRKTFLAFGSETDDNKAALNAVVVREFDPEYDFGFGGLATSGGPLSAILNSAEGCDIPTQVRTNYPDLTQGEWDAALRVATMALISFQAPSSQP
ncbi:MAG: hypothetical protein R3F13_17365 [Prosthecobacter sp.]